MHGCSAGRRSRHVLQHRRRPQAQAVAAAVGLQVHLHRLAPHAALGQERVQEHHHCGCVLCCTVLCCAVPCRCCAFHLLCRAVAVHFICCAELVAVLLVMRGSPQAPAAVLTPAAHVRPVALAEDSTAEEFMDFYLDDETRCKWDSMLSGECWSEMCCCVEWRCEQAALAGWPCVAASQRLAPSAPLGCSPPPLFLTRRSLTPPLPPCRDAPAGERRPRLALPGGALGAHLPHGHHRAARVCHRSPHVPRAGGAGLPILPCCLGRVCRLWGQRGRLGLQRG